MQKECPLITEEFQRISKPIRSTLKVAVHFVFAKTKELRNKHGTRRPVFVEGSVVEEVRSYIYLGQRGSRVETDLANEINRRIQAGWKSFNEHKIVLKKSIPNSLKKKLYNQCVLPAMTYASEIWTITKALER